MVERASLAIDVQITTRCAAPVWQRCARPPAKVVPAREDPDPRQSSRRARVLVRG